MSIYKHGQLVITLKSDLCVGSGYSYAGVVDTDACYDELGIPYIPGRRIKGCIREAAESILYKIYSDEELDELFGKKGSDHGSDLIVDNAYIEDYDAVRGYLSALKVCRPQEILEKYTHIIGQTQLEDGVADVGSLRYTRVVNHYDPMITEDNDPKELVFIADITCDAADRSWEMLSKAALATRHIGLKRNRGLGNVRIELKEPESASRADEAYIECTDFRDGRKILSFAVKNTQPLMLSRMAEDESVDHIPGQQVLGLLAGRYLKLPGRSAEDKAFKELFLNGNTIFSNLYPFDGESIYYPAPDYLNRLKKTKKIVYNIKSELPKIEEIKEPYWYEGGNQPKKLKGKFVAWKDANTVSVYEVKKDVMYHHSHRNTHETEDGKEEGILYSMEVIRRGQMFAGSIILPEEHADLIRDLLMEGDLSFGKSRTAQYGKCRLIKFKENSKSSVEYDSGKDIVVTFLSDAIINNEAGNATVFYDDVRAAIAGALGIDDVSSDENISSLQTTLATGYMGTWNLRRSPVPAIKAGSFLCYRLSKDISGEIHYVGEKTLEGYGQIRIDYVDGCKYDGIEEKPAGSETTSGSDDNIRSKVNGLLIPIVYDRWMNRRINGAITGKDKVDTSNSAAGRFILMLRESMAEAEKGDAKKTFDELFKKRIESIDTESTKNQGKKLISRAEKDFSSADDDLKSDLTKLRVEVDKTEMEKRKPQYMLTILIDRKYKGR